MHGFLPALKLLSSFIHLFQTSPLKTNRNNGREKKPVVVVVVASGIVRPGWTGGYTITEMGMNCAYKAELGGSAPACDNN